MLFSFDFSLFFVVFVLFFLFDVLKCINTQRYRRCDAVVIDDNAPSCTKRVVDTSAATAAANATNGPTKENDRRLKKHVDKCRTKTGMDVYYYIIAYCIVVVFVCVHVCAVVCIYYCAFENTSLKIQYLYL